ncbi:MAG: hypothetical protein ACYDHX_07910 [Methanothrix sp.]
MADLRSEAYAALSGQDVPDVWIIRTPEDNEGVWWHITKALRLGKVVEVSIKEVDRP